MKINTKCRYGSRALIEIALQYNAGPIKRKTIVENQNIPDSYLENILLSLKNTGIIKTVRGPNGGYILNRPPSEISFLDIVEALEGPLASVECINQPSFCPNAQNCLTRDVWAKLEETQRDFLKNFTIQDMLNKKKRIGKQS